MPTRSLQDPPAGTIRDLGLPGRAVTALTRAGVTSVSDLAALRRRDLAAIDGLGPGMIAAIRLVVPEPPAGPATDPEAERESPLAPAIPSFDSLRSPRHRTAVDLLVPDAAPEPPASPGAPRPPEYADLLRLGVRVTRAVAVAPARVALWSARRPVRCLRRLLGA